MKFGGNSLKSSFSITIPHLLRIHSNKAKFQDCIKQNVVWSSKHFQEQKLRATFYRGIMLGGKTIYLFMNRGIYVKAIELDRP